jgi:hypothetical protein
MSDKKITVEFTEGQYRDLLSLVYFGKWVADAEDNEEHTSNLENLEQLILSSSGAKKSTELVEYDKEADYYNFAPDFEEKLLEQLDEYDDAQFWESLVSRLTMRDMLLKYTEKEIEDLPEAQGTKEVEAIQKSYFDEFDANDVDNLKLVNPIKA